MNEEDIIKHLLSHKDIEGKSYIRQKIEQCPEGKYSIEGCCHGGCYVITDMSYCPFCGVELK